MKEELIKLMRMFGLTNYISTRLDLYVVFEPDLKL